MDFLRRAATIATLSIVTSVCAVPQGAAHAATLATIYTFPQGVVPQTGLVPGPGGALYGATSSSIYQLVQDAAGRWHEKTIFGTGAFTIVGSASALYAATNTGNTVFELDPPAKGSTVWKGTVLHTFLGGKDGTQPLGLALAPDGSLFGTTQLGGGAPACGSDNGVPTGCGTFFQLVEVRGRWGERLIHAFAGGADGAIPVASPSFDAAGNVYFSTSEGGTIAGNAIATPFQASPYRMPRGGPNEGCGAVWGYFRYLPGKGFNGNNLIDFCRLYGPLSFFFPESAVDSLPPVTPKISNGFPFGGTAASELIFTTTGGGDHSKFCVNTSYDGCGVVGLLTRPSTGKPPWDFKILHEFTGSDGFSPMGFLTSDGSRRVYGVAGSALGSCPDQGCGEIFTLAESDNGGWAFGVVYRFTTDVFPVTQLTLFKGKLLGTTSGYTSRGTIYELSP